MKKNSNRKNNNGLARGVCIGVAWTSLGVNI